MSSVSSGSIATTRSEFLRNALGVASFAGITGFGRKARAKKWSRRWRLRRSSTQRGL